jgi:hypothetical protein
MSLLSCTPMGTGSLSVSARPAHINSLGQSADITVSAFNADGTPGKGDVKVTSLAGSLVNSEMWTLDATGSTVNGFTCEVAKDPNCAASVRVYAQWTDKDHNALAGDVHVTIDATGAGGGAGGAGGGSGVHTNDGGFCGDSDLLLCYQFEEGSGSVLVDGSGHGNDGTVQNASWVNGTLQFDTTSNVRAPASFGLGTQLTVQFDIQGSMLSQYNPVFLDNGSWGIFGVMGSLCGFVHNRQTGPIYFCSPSLDFTGSGHVTMTWDNLYVRLYVDQRDVRDLPMLVNSGSDDMLGPLYLGRTADGMPWTVINGVLTSYTGTMDNLRIWRSVVPPMP